MVTYDCVHHFEPRTARPLSSPFEIPESIFMFQETLIIFDHLFQTLKLVSHVFLPPTSSPSEIDGLYKKATETLRELGKTVLAPGVPLPHQPPIVPDQVATSNVGKEGYESFVTDLKKHIVKGDIIQAVPSQRLSRPTTLHPFNAYRQLRSTNPSPYMFYIDFGDLQLVGASPETLCKVEKRKVYNHAIAGTVMRGKTPEGGFFTPPPSFLPAVPFSPTNKSTFIIIINNRGRRPRCRSARERKGPGGAHHARRPGPKRRQPRLPAFDRQGRRAHAGREV